MQHTISMRVTQEQIAKEQRRRMAVIQSGHAFIVLELLDRNKRRVSGIDDLVPIPSEIEGKYNFDIVSRQLQFDVDPNRGGIMTAYVLDTEWNRKFLASHLDSGYWEIVSVISGRKGKTLVLDEVLQELAQLRDKLAQEAIDSKSGHGVVPNLLPKDTRGLDIANLENDALEEQLKIMMEEKARRETKQQYDVKGKVPENPEGLKDSNKYEDEPKLTPAQKAARTRKANKLKAAIMESRKEDAVSVDSKDDPVQSDGVPESDFVTTSPAGMVQP